MATLLAVCIILEVLIVMTYYVKYMVPKFTFSRFRVEEKSGTLGFAKASAEYYEIYKDGRRLKCGDVLDELGRGTFINALTEFLTQRNAYSKDSFYYLLMTPFQSNFLSRPFTLVIMKDGSWAAQKADKRVASWAKYSEHVLDQCYAKDAAPVATGTAPTDKRKSLVMTFRSKEENTLLVCPCPNKLQNFSDISKFLSSATSAERKALFRQIQLEALLYFATPEGQAGVPLFVNTHGLDIPWLHVRLETPLPKHYTELKNWYDKMP